MSAPFALDPRLAADTAPACDLGLSRVLVMGDARFPWLILVPRRAGVAEIFELGKADQAALMRELSAAAAALARLTRSDKINVGALGNIVRQLHVHVVARRIGDPAWPGPVWGHGVRVTYDEETLKRFVADVARELSGGRPGG